MLELRERLIAQWQRKKEYLEDLYNQQMFLRDVNQLETLSNTQEVVSIFCCHVTDLTPSVCLYPEICLGAVSILISVYFLLRFPFPLSVHCVL